MTPSTRVLHRGDDRLHAEPATDEVDVERGPEVCFELLLDSAHRDDTRIVDEYVDPTPELEHVLQRSAPVRGRRHVEVLVGGAGSEVGGELGAVVVEHVTDEHARAFGDERLRLGRALTTGGAGDDRDLAVEPSHRNLVRLPRLRSQSFVRTVRHPMLGEHGTRGPDDGIER